MKQNGLQLWQSQEEQASLLLIHGAGEHIGRYQWVIEQFNQAGFTVYGGDLPGFGQSNGKKGHVDRFEEYTEQVSLWWQHIVEKAAHPVFVLGHSMGGLVVAHWMETNTPQKVAGVLLSSPAMGVAVPIPAWKEKLSQWLNRLTPGLRMPSGITPDLVSRDTEICQKYQDDPLVISKLSVRWFREFVRAMEETKEKAHDFPATVPLLVMQAEQDRIVSPQATQAWFERLTLIEKELHIMPSLYHEILNEPEKQDVLDTMISWMNKQIAGKGEE